MVAQRRRCRHGLALHCNKSGKKAPDVILLDLSLPDMNGLELAKVVRRSDKTNSIPILAMSASRMDRKKCLQMGCNDFILKPFSIAALLVRLSALMSPLSDQPSQ